MRYIPLQLSSPSINLRKKVQEARGVILGGGGEGQGRGRAYNVIELEEYLTLGLGQAVTCPTTRPADTSPERGQEEDILHLRRGSFRKLGFADISFWVLGRDSLPSQRSLGLRPVHLRILEKE